MKLSKFQVTSGIALLALSLNTPAAIINATTSWTLDNTSSTYSPDSQSLNTSSGTVDVIGSDSSTTGSSIFYHTYGNTDGVFGSRVSGAGTFDITGQFAFSNSYQNTSNTSQNAEFAFSIIPGELSVNYPGTMKASENLFASYSIDILFNGTSIWDSAASVTLDNAGYTFSDTGTHSINGTYNTVGSYYWGNFNETLSLGSIGAGESFTIDYILTTTAKGTFNDGICTNAPSEETLFLPAFPALGVTDGPSSSQCGTAVARSGDPNNPSFGNNGTVNFKQPNPVPEPSILLLFGLGLTGLFVTKKKQA